MAAKKLSKTIDTEAQTVTFEFADKTTIVAALADFSAEIVLRLALHGLSQKGGDSTASEEKVEDCIKAVQAVVDQLKAGDWSQKREGGGGPRVGLLVEALARVTGRSHEECLAAVDGLSDEDKKVVRGDAQIRKAIAEIRFEREQAKAAKANAEGAPDLLALMAKGAAAAEGDADEEDGDEE